MARLSALPWEATTDRPFMKRTTITMLLTLASQHALGAIEPGDYIFLYGRLVDCGDRVYVVDYAEVPANGEVEFFEGFEIAVGDLSEDEIVSHLVKAITEQTGHTEDTVRSCRIGGRREADRHRDDEARSRAADVSPTQRANRTCAGHRLHSNACPRAAVCSGAGCRSGCMRTNSRLVVS